MRDRTTHTHPKQEYFPSRNRQLSTQAVYPYTQALLFVPPYI